VTCQKLQLTPGTIFTKMQCLYGTRNQNLVKTLNIKL